MGEGIPPCVEASPTRRTASNKTKNKAATPMLTTSTWCSERPDRLAVSALAASAVLKRGDLGEGVL
jgi:hypothetical protein